MTAPTNDALVATLISAAFGDHAGALVVPEPVVKEVLRDLGATVPRGLTASVTGELAALALDLEAPLVLKAFGPGVIHKSDLGAVRLGLDVDSLDESARAMRERLRKVDIAPAGFLVEEQQQHEGVELIIGVVRDQSFGSMVMLGLGGTATEILDLVEFRALPLSREDAEDLLSTFPGAPLLQGARGSEPVDSDALIDLLLRIAGPDGLVSQLGASLDEFECNPVLASSAGAFVLDARLILREPPPPGTEQPEGTDFTALFRPREVAIAGASTKGTGFGNRFIAAYKDIGRVDDLVTIHPTATEIDGVRALREVPTDATTDYLMVAVPASAAVDVVRQAVGHVRFVHIISGGFSEMGEQGRAMEQEMLAAAAGTPTRLIGPNCIGVYSPAGRQAFSLGADHEPGVVSVISQSGGLSGDLVTVGNRRGLRYAKLISIGNAIDVTAAELLDWLIDDPETAVIGLYLEGADDGARMLRALRRARGRKPVVILSGGTSQQGARAVSSHTGSLAAPAKIWSAVEKATQFTRVATLEDLIATLGHLETVCRLPAAQPSTLVIGSGGGASVLATDACSRAALDVGKLEDQVQHRLRELGHGAGTSVANPVEIPIGPASRVDLLGETLQAIIELQEFSDVIIHVNVAAYYSYGNSGLVPLIDTLNELESRSLGVRASVVTRNIDVARATDLDRIAEFRAKSSVSLFRTLDEAATAVAAGQRFDRARTDLTW